MPSLPVWLIEPSESPVHGEATLLERPKLKRPPMYRVVLFNDDYTPMEFVIVLLQQVFGVEHQAAVRVMLKIHTEGRGTCGSYSREVAETLSAQCIQLARAHEHPLHCEIEPDADSGEDE